MHYRREIDGLRAIAVLSVILFHAGVPALQGGYVGVDIFFVISGYLITNTICAKKKAGTFTLLGFYEQRARRILPALFVMMLICLPLAFLLLLPGEMIDFSNSLIAVSLFTSNFLFWKTSDYFNTSIESTPLLHTWSLGIEEQYYLLFPLFLIISWRYGKKWLIFLLIMITSISLMAGQWCSIHHPAAAFYLLPTRAWELLIGACTTTCFSQHSFQHVTRQVGSLFGLLLISYAILIFDRQTPFPSVYALVPTIGTALILVLGTPSTWVGKFLKKKLLVTIGLISYSAYLWHQPLFAFTKLTIENPSPVLMSALIMITFTLAYFSWKYVEFPFRNLQYLTRRNIYLLSFFGSALFILFGLIGNLTNGFLARYSEHDQAIASIHTPTMGKYTGKKFNELSMKKFDPSNKKQKILIIGDSFGQDLVNALYENGLTEKLQISTYYINHQCGNLFIQKYTFSHLIGHESERLCLNQGLYEDQNLRPFMLEADEIWFISAWKNWQLAFFPQSIHNVSAISAKPIKIFGCKSFGKINIKNILSTPYDQRLSLKGRAEESALNINRQLEATLEAPVFIDVQKLLCGPEETPCALLTKEGKLISYDGSHLTPAGAQYLGAKLMQHQQFRKMLPPPNL